MLWRRHPVATAGDPDDDEVGSRLRRSMPVYDRVLVVDVDYSHHTSPSIDREAAYFVCFVSMWLLIIAIFANRGIPTCGAVLCYVTALSTMTLVLKELFMFWDSPLFLTSLHFLCTMSIAFLILLGRKYFTGESLPAVGWRLVLTGVGPVAFFFLSFLRLVQHGFVHEQCALFRDG
eukprot:TRINITY_DN64034_c0_g1_i1.p2 TRINITY_DN64034_c0_g1~~TRINITY_DN64034_c0_g1_i1.p2  ORF type:complete len:176 (-),score=31.77 TRINITY_DN64034_c0_g1_i1:801-1328(-)